MKILLLGGKKFLGYHMVAEALKMGHEVTIFTRGKTNPHLYPDVPTVTGERATDLHKLDGMRFDAVLDTSCYFPYQMRASSEYFKDKVPLYLFISTLSVNNIEKANVSEDDIITDLDFESRELKEDNYNKMKAACEVILTEAMGERACIVRPGLICGERDNTDRMTYYPMKMYYSDKIILPDEDLNFQLVDARDLAIFSINMAEKKQPGVYIVTGPDRPYPFSEFIEQCRQIANPNCEIIRLSDGQLDRFGLLKPTKCIPFPIWYSDIPEVQGIYTANISKALAAGLTLRDPRETIKAALDWFVSTNVGVDGAATGLTGTREQEIIAELGL